MIKIGSRLIVCLVFICSVAYAGVKVSSSISSQVVPLNSSFVYQVQIESDKNINLNQPHLPALKGFNILGQSQSSQYSMINGKVSHVKTFKYTMEPTMLGRLDIPSLTLTFAGKNYVTQKHVLDVTKGSKISSDSKSLPQIFIKSELDKKTVYVGEPLTHTIKLYYRVRLFDASYNEPQYNGVIVKKDDSINSNYREFVGGREYIVDSIKSVLIPTYASDKIIIPPASISYQTGFFESARKLSSDPASFKVLALPKTDDKFFTGAVGDYELSIDSQKKQVKAGDAITLNITVKGFGNVENIVFPEININKDIKNFGSKEFTNTSFKDGKLYGEKTKEYVLVPSIKGNYNMGNYRFTWFSPAKKQYISKTLKMPDIQVLKGDINTINHKTGVDNKLSIEKVSDDIRYLKKLKNNSYYLIYKKRYFSFIIITFYILLLCIFLYKLFVFLNIAKAIDKSRSSTRKYLKTLNDARKYLDAGDEKKAAELSMEYIRRVISDAYDISFSGITSSSIKDLSDNSQPLIEIYNHLESIAYAPSSKPIAEIINDIPNVLERMIHE